MDERQLTEARKLLYGAAFILYDKYSNESHDDLMDEARIQLSQEESDTIRLQIINDSSTLELAVVQMHAALSILLGEKITIEEMARRFHDEYLPH